MQVQKLIFGLLISCMVLPAFGGKESEFNKIGRAKMEAMSLMSRVLNGEQINSQAVANLERQLMALENTTSDQLKHDGSLNTIIHDGKSKEDTKKISAIEYCKSCFGAIFGCCYTNKFSE